MMIGKSGDNQNAMRTTLSDFLIEAGLLFMNFIFRFSKESECLHQSRMLFIREKVSYFSCFFRNA